jgi:hypothetical protein
VKNERFSRKREKNGEKRGKLRFLGEKESHKRESKNRLVRIDNKTMRQERGRRKSKKPTNSQKNPFKAKCFT